MSKRRKSLFNYLRSLSTLLGTQPKVKQNDFASPCNIKNSDGIENGGRLRSAMAQNLKGTVRYLKMAIRRLMRSTLVMSK